MVTLRDIALKVGVDTSTVSKVLKGVPIRVSPATRDEIEKAAQEMGYQPNSLARALRLKRSGAVAMVIPSTTNYLYPEIIAGAEEAAEDAGYLFLLVKTSRRDPLEQLLQLVQQSRADGLLFADDMPTPDTPDILVREKIPFVCLNRLDPKIGRFVALDDQAGFSLQARHLYDCGHRTVAFVATSPLSPVAKICRHAFRVALAQKGVPIPDPRILSCDFGGEEAESVADSLLAMRPRITAVATASVIVASRLVAVFQNKGVSVPEDISVLGYHDSPMAAWPPPGVTTVKMPSREQGALGVSRLLEVIGGKPCEGEIIKTPPTILERGTCRRLDRPA